MTRFLNDLIVPLDHSGLFEFLSGFLSSSNGYLGLMELNLYCQFGILFSHHYVILPYVIDD